MSLTKIRRDLDRLAALALHRRGGSGVLVVDDPDNFVCPPATPGCSYLLVLPQAASSEEWEREGTKEMIDWRTTLTALRNAVEKMKARPLDPAAMHEGLRQYEETGELPESPRLREEVVAIAQFLAEADWVSNGDAWNGLPPPSGPWD